MRAVMTGATGFIGRNLLARLLEREEQVFAIVRPGSIERLRAIGRRLGVDDRLIVPIEGDLGEPRLGVSDGDLERISRAEHFFHVAAVYDLAADATSTGIANVDGTRHALELAGAAEVRCFHQLSSIAVAGRYDGTFTETMLDEAIGLDHPYFATKHESERLVRETSPVPWRVYRPSLVVGRSDNGEMDKVDGPYYFFSWLKRLAAVPNPAPVALPFDGLVNIVPVDYVAAAIDHIAHREGLDCQVFHIVDPAPLSVVQVLDRFSRVAGGPRFVTLPLPGPARALVNGLVRAPRVWRSTGSACPRRSPTTSPGRPVSTRRTPMPRSPAAASRCRRSTRMRECCGTSGASGSTRPRGPRASWAARSAVARS